MKALGDSRKLLGEGECTKYINPFKSLLLKLHCSRRGLPGPSGKLLGEGQQDVEISFKHVYY